LKLLCQSGRLSNVGLLDAFVIGVSCSSTSNTRADTAEQQHQQQQQRQRDEEFCHLEQVGFDVLALDDTLLTLCGWRQAVTIDK